MLIVNGQTAQQGVSAPSKPGVYCFVDNNRKVIFANSTSDVSKGFSRHQEKLSHNQHRVKEFLDSYNCGDIILEFFPAETMVEADIVFDNLSDNKEYKLVRL